MNSFLIHSIPSIPSTQFRYNVRAEADPGDCGIHDPLHTVRPADKDTDPTVSTSALRPTHLLVSAKRLCATLSEPLVDLINPVYFGRQNVVFEVKRRFHLFVFVRSCTCLAVFSGARLVYVDWVYYFAKRESGVLVAISHIFEQGS